MPEFLQPILDILHDLPGFLDRFVEANGVWVYVLLFAIIFAETGLVIMPFLPGDSLLFAAGAVAARGSMNPWILSLVLIVAAVIGDAVNYHLGKWIGPRIFSRGPSTRAAEPRGSHSEPAAGARAAHGRTSPPSERDAQASAATNVTAVAANTPQPFSPDLRPAPGPASDTPPPASQSLGHLPRDAGEEGAVSHSVRAAAAPAPNSPLQRLLEKALNKKHLDRAHAFFEKYGGKAVVLARFVPIVRTFIPFVAGAGAMNYGKFFYYNVLGAVLWVGICVGAGWFFGNIAWVQKNFEAVIIAIIVISLIPLAVEFILAKRRAAMTPVAEGAA